MTAQRIVVITEQRIVVITEQLIVVITEQRIVVITEQRLVVIPFRNNLQSLLGFEDVVDRLSRNVGKELPPYAA
jgi:hypothetical protein